MRRWLSGLRRTIGNRVKANTLPEVQILFSAPRASAFEPRGKHIEICVSEWYNKRVCRKTSKAEKLREQL